MASRLDPLLHALYACPDGSGSWCETLDLIGSAFGARSAVIQVLFPVQGRLRSAWHRRDSNSERNRALHESVLPDSENPRLKIGGAHLSSTGSVVRDADLFAADRTSLAELQARLAALQLGSFMGGALPLDEARYVTLALHRDLGDRADFRGRDEALLEHLLPHVRRAIGFALRLESEQRRNLLLSGALDQLACGVLICDSRGHAVWSNATARSWVAASTQGGARSPLSTWLGRSAAQFPARSPQWVVHDDLHLKLCPVQGTGETLVFVSRRAQHSLVPEGLIARMFGLTPAEASLAAALCGGRALDAHAAARGVTLGTVRCQLKQVLRKTQCTRQSDLVRLVLNSIVARTRHD